MHQRLTNLKQEGKYQDSLPAMTVSAVPCAPATATVAPLLAPKIDPSQAYSLGMSRRKLFMMQQLEDQRGVVGVGGGGVCVDDADSSIAVGISASNSVVGVDPSKECNSAVPDDSSDFASNPSLYAEKPGGGGGVDVDSTNAASAAAVPSASASATSGGGAAYECQHCDIVFGDCVMYTMHMGYHGFHDPLKCNMCGYDSADKVDFFLHIARVAHA